jgi:5-methylcytosine-specific restriction endonuclease McrA
MTLPLDCKLCGKCKTAKPLTEFGKHKLHKDGRQSVCKECKKKVDKDYNKNNKEKIKVYLQNNKDKIGKRRSSYNKAHKEEISAYNRKRYVLVNAEKKRIFYQNNKKHCRNLEIAWKKKNPEKAREINSRWRRSNREKVREIEKQAAHRRRARLREVENTFTKEEWQKILEYYNSKCFYCDRSDVAMTVDHFLPISKGGANAEYNIVPACHMCNSTKNDHNPLEFLWKIENRSI